jgi:histidine triad (HIT) family protein
MTTQGECLFCQMADGSFEVEKVHEDGLVFAIRDIAPRAPVHVLIVPREHVPSVRELSDQHAALLWHMVGVANALAERFEILERGYRLAFNVGDEGGQTVFHLHLHLLGGRPLGAEG